MKSSQHLSLNCSETKTINDEITKHMRMSTKSLPGTCGARIQSSLQTHGLSPVFLHSLFSHKNRAGSSGHFLSSSLAGKVVASSKEQDRFVLQGQCIKTKNTRACSGASMFFRACGKFCQPANPADPAQAPGS